MSIYQAVTALLGDVPTGTEPIVYIFCMILCLFLTNSIISFIFSFFKR